MDPSSFTSLIVTHNSAGEIAQLLDDLYRFLPDNKIIVIDNASRDETVGLVQEQFPRVQLIQNSSNVGYARAVNQGFDLCETESVLLMNPDIRVSSPEPVAEMEKCLKHSRQIAAVAPLQFKHEAGTQRINFTWSYMTPDTFKLYLSFALQRKQAVSGPMRVTFLNAGCLLIRRSAFELVGRLNERYFLYGEEPDLFLKFKRAGFECFLLPNVGVTHYRERSLKTRPPWQRLQLRILSAWNVADALIHGWTNILLDRLAVRRSQPVTGKRTLKHPG